MTFTAIVASGGQPVDGGTVQFRDGTIDLGDALVLGPTGIATYQMDDLSAGAHTITATFSGTTEIAGSSGTFDQVVEKAPTVTVLATIPDPSTFGQLVTFTAQVSDGWDPAR